MNIQKKQKDQGDTKLHAIRPALKEKFSKNVYIYIYDIECE